jgi:manganese/zinc/iron transport system ATP- binding protein
MTPTDVAIEVHDLTVSYGDRPVLWNVDLLVPEAQMVAVIGPNGAGKSTFLRAILGLLPAVHGSILITKGSSTIGYVPQRESVDWDFPVTALDVVIMGRYGRIGWFRRPSKADRNRARECLEEVGIADLADRQISQLSGGQQQRVFLARALAQDADIYLLDEPFAGVDASTEQQMLLTLRRLKAAGKTVVVVHHDLQTVRSYFDWVIMLNLRAIASGAIEQVFTNENLQKTYGGRLTLLDQLTEAVRTAHPRQEQDSSEVVR